LFPILETGICEAHDRFCLILDGNIVPDV